MTQADLSISAPQKRASDTDLTVLEREGRPVKAHDATGMKVQDLAKFNSFKNFTILSFNERSKSCVVLFEKSMNHGDQCDATAVDGHHCEDTDRAVVTFETRALVKDELPNAFRDLSGVELVESNDKYHRFISNQYKFMVIHPATQAHVAKYSLAKHYMVTETYQDFCTHVKPYAESIPESRIAWVRNIVQGKSEQEAVVYRDPSEDTNGFVLVPDSKWDQKTIESLYLVAICCDRDVLCLRSLNASHLPLLKHMREKILESVPTKFGVGPSELRLFIHYQPSYYHFHVHVTHIALDFPGMMVGQSHLLEQVIENIEIQGDFYQRVSMRYGLSSKHQLFPKLGRPEDVSAN